jgi:uncharacterized protein (DUF3084 family)
MRIIETEVNDIPKSNLNDSKNNLANSVISYVYPLFNENYRKQVKEVKELKEALNSKKEKVHVEKNKLKTILKEYDKKNKESQLLKKMGKLIHTGLIQDSMKKEMVVLLKSFEHMKEDKISSYLNETIKILSQKFAKR